MKKFLFILVYLSSISASAQHHNEFEFLYQLKQETKISDEKYSLQIKSPADLIFGGLLLFYKNLISSQDGPVCHFTPSCSVYGYQSIQKHGLVIGILNAFDRITRCNGKNAADYEKDEKTGLLIDPA